MSRSATLHGVWYFNGLQTRFYRILTFVAQRGGGLETHPRAEFSRLLGFGWGALPPFVGILGCEGGSSPGIFWERGWMGRAGLAV